jgi:hypothetical protein
VKADRHLTEEALILLTTGDCSEEFRREATGHLQSCPRCRHDCEQVSMIFGAMEQASERGLLSLPSEHRRQSLYNWKKSAFPWVPIGSILGSSLLLIFAVLGPFTARSASASELLDRAVLNERHFGTPHAFEIVVNGVKCGRSKSGSEILLLESATACERVSTSIKETPWGIGNPLAASTFRDWHASLADHHDTVTKLPALWTINTSTSGGAVRDARLTLRKGTYHPVKLDLHFEDDEDVTIEEDDQPFSDAPLTAVVQTRPQTQQIQTSSPADLLEIEAWQLLHNLNGDTGWEATVARRGDFVVVEAEVLTLAREQEYKTAFAPYPKIELNVRKYADVNTASNFLPQRTNEAGGAPPLAEKWLEENFPDSGERSQFVNSTVRLSKAILGQTYILEELEKRRAALSSCSCAHTLDSLIETTKTDLLAERELLRSSLDPVLGTSQQTASRSITIAAAQRLDVGLVRLFFTAPMSGATTLDDEENVVRKLL